MTEFSVYHTKNWALNANLHFDTKGYVPEKDNYKLVALVQCDELGQTFHYTNHIDVAWWKNDCVTLVEESRSTSVGDVVLDHNTGKIYLCESLGWREIEEGWILPEPWIDGKILSEDEIIDIYSYYEKEEADLQNSLYRNPYHADKKEEADLQNSLYRKEIF